MIPITSVRSSRIRGTGREGKYDPLTLVGETLLHYQITTQLGEGGMGVVYQATDTRLNREVAIKVLPEAFVEDAERLARFEREAQLLAALNHPNIGGIYGLEEADGVRFLVLELLRGDPRAERMGRGAWRGRVALPTALQIARALEAAHAQGIVHRDLEPDNVKVTPGGTSGGGPSGGGSVKVLDFGLAKAWDQPADSGLTHSPTLTAQMTQAGVILGTASYMSPEQARGQAVDKRTDIWAFGVVLFEMLTGGKIYSGATVTDILGAIVHKEPDWERLPPDVPEAIERLLRRCLEKDAGHRLQDIGDARIEIEECLEAGEAAPTRGASAPAERRSSPLPWAIAIGALALAAWAFWVRGPEADLPVATSSRWSVALPEDLTLARQPGAIDLSRDGRLLALVARNDHESRLVVRDRTDGSFHELRDSRGARTPFFSPDGQAIGYWRGGALWAQPLDDSRPTRIVDSSYTVGADWSDRDEILYSPDWGTGIRRVSADGGESELVTFLDESTGESSHLWPTVLPGGEVALFLIWRAFDGGSVALGATRIGTGEHVVLVEDAIMPRYSSTGHLLFTRGDTLMAAPFDAETLALLGEPRVVTTGVRGEMSSITSAYALSEEGTLAFASGGMEAPRRQLVRVSLEGEVEPVLEDIQPFDGPAVSPDGRRVAVALEGILFQIWLYDLESAGRTQLTRESDNGQPAWTPDGSELIFWSARVTPYGVFRLAVDGSRAPEMLYKGTGDIEDSEVSPDGRWVLFVESGGAGGFDIMQLDLTGESEPGPVVSGPGNQENPSFSPDGRWLAYESDETGTPQIYVTPFPGPGRHWLVSAERGLLPSWSPDGRQLYFVNGDWVLAVDIDTTDGFRAGRPRRLFEDGTLTGGYSVFPDGDFLMIRDLQLESPNDRLVEVVLDWPRLVD